MMLKQLLKGCEMPDRSPEKTSCADRDISGVSYDSRNVKNGDIFVAIRGEKNDGHQFIRDALRKGVVAVVHERADAGYGTGEGGGILHPVLFRWKTAGRHWRVFRIIFTKGRQSI